MTEGDPRAILKAAGVECPEVGRFMDVVATNSTHWCRPEEEAVAAIRALTRLVAEREQMLQRASEWYVLAREADLKRFGVPDTDEWREQDQQKWLADLRMDVKDDDDARLDRRWEEHNV